MPAVPAGSFETTLANVVRDTVLAGLRGDMRALQRGGYGVGVRNESASLHCRRGPGGALNVA